MSWSTQSQLEFPAGDKVRKAELDMAKMLINNLAAEWDPLKYTDEYRDNLMKLIKARIKGRRPKLPQAEEPQETKVVDLMERLRQSLESRRRQSTRRAKGKRQDAAKKLDTPHDTAASQHHLLVVALRSRCAACLQGDRRCAGLVDQVQRDAGGQTPIELKAVIATQENGFLPWSRKHFFDREEFDRDVKRIEAYYADKGYPNAEVVGVDVQLNAKRTRSTSPSRLPKASRLSSKYFVRGT